MLLKERVQFFSWNSGKQESKSRSTGANPLNQEDKERLNAVEVTCNFLNMGCETSIKLNERSAHIDHCIYRPINCPMNCGDTIMYNDLGDHLLQCRRASVVTFMPQMPARNVAGYKTHTLWLWRICDKLLQSAK